MKRIHIVTEDIVVGTKKMKDRFGRLDLLGQILFTGYKIHIQPHAETPANQETLIHPFTILIRERVHNTELTLKLLRNAESMSGLRQLEAANPLLAPYKIELVKVEL